MWVNSLTLFFSFLLRVAQKCPYLCLTLHHVTCQTVSRLGTLDFPHHWKDTRQPEGTESLLLATNNIFDMMPFKPHRVILHLSIVQMKQIRCVYQWAVETAMRIYLFFFAFGHSLSSCFIDMISIDLLILKSDTKIEICIIYFPKCWTISPWQK